MRFYRAIKVGTETQEQKNRSSFAAAAVSNKVYIKTGVEGFDKTIGGGLVAGSPILLAGFHGSGKSTMLCLVCDGVANEKGRALYASSEEGAEGVVSIAHRLGLRNENVEILGNQHSVESVIEHAKATKPFLTVFDSLQKYTSNMSGGSAGSTAQGEAVCTAVLNYCRETKRCAIIINQMAKSGELRGSSDAAHAVDTVLVLAYPRDDDKEAPEDEEVRVLSVEKNRNGAVLRTYWKMHGETDPRPGFLEYLPAKSKIISMGKYRKRDD